jgi:MYXO-CTERM domain-containing protein
MTLRSPSAVSGLLLTLGLFFANPGSAAAAEVMCSNDFGSCTVSNDNFSFVSCNCGEFGGSEGSGGDEFDGLTEAELLEVCNDHLAVCEDFGGDGDGDPTDGTTGGWDTGVDTDETGVDTGVDTGDVTGDETGVDTGVDTDTADTGTDSTDTGVDTDTAEGGDGNDGDPTTGDSTSGDSEGTGEEGVTTGDDSGDGDGDPGDGDGDPGESGGETGEEGPVGTDDGQEGGDDETGAPADAVEGGGCSVATHSGLGLIGLMLLGLFGLHRREQRDVV